MPLAGRDPTERHRAHMRWAERRTKSGDVASAIAHFGRALDYDRSRFGVQVEDERLLPTLSAMLDKYEVVEE